MKKRAWLTLLLFGAAGVTPGLARSEEIVVTANRSPQAASRVGQQVTVLDREEIAASQASLVSDLLVRTPGVSVSSNGGPGSVTSLRIRGAEADQTLAVIDGVKLNDPSSTGGGYNFGNLLVGDIARIEVLRGAQSTLWGSQAIGGIVNITTTEPSAPVEASVQFEGGARGTGSVRAGLSGASERLVWRLAGSSFTTEGFSAARAGDEKDGYDNIGLSARAGARLTDAIGLDVRALYSDARVEFDGFPAPSYTFADTREYGETDDFIGYAGLTLDLFDARLRNRIAYNHTETERRNFDPDQAVTALTFEARGVNKRFEYQGVAALRKGWTATFGAEHEESSFRTASPSSSTPNPAPSKADIGLNGAYAQLQADVTPGLALTFGVRRDEHDAFGGQTLGQAAAAWTLNGGATVLRASFGEGFKAPSLYQLYSSYGNLALRPEEASSYDFGVEQRVDGDRLVVSATYFSRDTENQIDFASCTSASADPLCVLNGVRRFGYYENLARTTARGVEAAAAARLGQVTLEANYTWTDAENDAPGANRGKQLARRPAHQANLTATYVWRFALSTTLALRYTGESFDNAANTTRLAEYTLLDLRAAYPLSETLELYGRIENLGDERYETTRNYGTAGRGGFLGARARF